MLLFTTGIRVSELVNIRIGDVDLEHRVLRVRGKGDRERQVFLTTDEVVSELISYKAQQRYVDNSSPLFQNRIGNGLSTACVRRGLRKLGSNAGLLRRITPHMLRHSAATSLIEAGVDIRFVQRLLGHQSISTTEIYTHVSDEKLKFVVTAADTIGRLNAG
jgi:integrase/recombinase XerD